MYLNYSLNHCRFSFATAAAAVAAAAAAASSTRLLYTHAIGSAFICDYTIVACLTWTIILHGVITSEHTASVSEHCEKITLS